MNASKILKIGDYGAVNLNNPKEALDYLIYLSEDSRRLIDISLAFGLEKISLSDFYKTFYSYDEAELAGYLIQYPYEFYDTFISKNDSFIFETYFFENPSTSDIEKIAKINRLIGNIKNLLIKIKEETQTDNLVAPDWRNVEEFVGNFKKRFPNDLVTSNYQSEKAFKVKQYPQKLLLFYFGVTLNEVLEKLYNNYVGYIKEQTFVNNYLQIKPNHTSFENLYPEFFKSNQIYEKFMTYSSNHIIEPYRDYSYLFQRLKKEELIFDVKHKKFIDWLISQNLITKKDYDIFIDNGGFRSYSKSYHVERENNFNNIFKK